MQFIRKKMHIPYRFKNSSCFRDKARYKVFPMDRFRQF